MSRPPPPLITLDNQTIIFYCYKEVSIECLCQHWHSQPILSTTDVLNKSQGWIKCALTCPSYLSRRYACGHRPGNVLLCNCAGDGGLIRRVFWALAQVAEGSLCHLLTAAGVTVVPILVQESCYYIQLAGHQDDSSLFPSECATITFIMQGQW